MSEKKVLTGKPSQDRPWRKYYPDSIDRLFVPDWTIAQFIRKLNENMDARAINYYGTDITWATFWKEVDRTARALKALGFGENDQIPVFLRSVPEFLMIFFAAEKIGASTLCRDNTLAENIDAVQKSGAKAIIASEFLPQEELDAYLSETACEKCVLVSPWRLADRSAMPDHVVTALEAIYPDQPAGGPATMDWDAFIAAGERYDGPVEAPIDLDRPTFRVYTSGSTGPSKQVIHSQRSMMGVLCQMCSSWPDPQQMPGGFQPTLLLAILPPCLLAVTLAMMILPMASGMVLILDPFVDPADIDLEVMRYRPNVWPVIPMLLEFVLRSKRVPADYDMSHLIACGVGAESFNNGQQRRANKFFKEHNCGVVCTSGYGQTEAGSTITLPCPDFANHPILDGNAGIPLPMSNVAIFKPGTQEELGYNEPGELCKTGPGVMLGYDNAEATAKALQMHDDGNLWLHTGDIAYMDEDGVLYLRTRGESPRFGGGDLQVIPMENRLADAKIAGIDDEFFVLAKDPEHEGCFLPYLYLVLNPGYTLDDVTDAVNAAMEDFQRPAAIVQLPERPYFHFKTNRIGLSKTLNSEK